MVTVFIINTLLCVLCLTLFLIVRVIRGGIPGLLTKTLASLAFLFTGLIALVFSTEIMVGVLICCGLACGLIGDILLDLKVIYKEDNDIYLNSGMIAFGMGHLFYLTSLIFIAISLKINLLLPILVPACIALVFSVATIFGAGLLKMNFGKFKWQSAAYSFILSFVCGVAIYLAALIGSGSVLYLFAIGLGLILVSDLVLCKQYFGGMQDNKYLVIANHAIYYVGQIMIALMLFYLI